MDIRDYNRHAWDGYVANGNTWTKPVTAAGGTVAAEARPGGGARFRVWLPSL